MTAIKTQKSWKENVFSEVEQQGQVQRECHDTKDHSESPTFILLVVLWSRVEVVRCQMSSDPITLPIIVPLKRTLRAPLKAKVFWEKIFGKRLGRDKKFQESCRSVRRSGDRVGFQNVGRICGRLFLLTLPDILENLMAQFNVQFILPWDRNNSSVYKHQVRL